MTDVAAKRWKRREILKQIAVASTAMLVPGEEEVNRPLGATGNVERDFEIRICSVGAYTVRVSVVLVTNGRPVAIPTNGSLVQASFGTPVATFRGDGRSRTVKCGE